MYRSRPRGSYGRLRGGQWNAMPSYMRMLIVGAAAAGGVFVISHVEKIPQTGRRRIMLLSPKTEAAMGKSTSEAILQSATVLPATHPMSRAVHRVGAKIAQCAQSENPHLKWQFFVIDAEDPNAFCLPGGYVFVHTGLFRILQNEDTLAAVLFHEAAHGIARHGAEKVSFSLLAYAVLGSLFPDAGQFGEAIMKVAVDLPYSRKLEYEADLIGLRMMARACYDPRASLQMHAALGNAAKHQHSATEKYFSTHPPTKERLAALKA